MATITKAEPVSFEVAQAMIESDAVLRLGRLLAHQDRLHTKMSVPLTVSAPVSILWAPCPVCKEHSQVMGDLLTCSNLKCDSAGKSWTVEFPRVDVVLREA